MYHNPENRIYFDFNRLEALNSSAPSSNSYPESNKISLFGERRKKNYFKDPHIKEYAVDIAYFHPKLYNYISNRISQSNN